MVIDKAAVEDQAAVRLEGAGNHIGGVGMGAVVGGRASAAFGIRLDEQPGKVWNGGVEFIDFGTPPGCDGGVQRIECRKAADGLRAGEIDRKDDADAPVAKRGGDPGDLRQKVRG